MNTKDEEYLLERINSAFTQKWYKVTPEFMRELKKEREEYQKSKYIRNHEKPIENFGTSSANHYPDWLYTLFS